MTNANQIIVGSTLEGLVMMLAPEWQQEFTPDEALWMAGRLQEFAEIARRGFPS